MEQRIEENTSMNEFSEVGQQLCEPSEMFTKVFRASPDPISIATLAEGRYIDVNDSFLNLFGYTRQEVIGFTSVELGFWINPEERDRIKQLVQTQGAIQNIEFDYRTKSNEIKTLLLSAEIIEVDGQACILCLGKDITERKHVDAILKNSEAKLRNILSSAGAVIARFRLYPNRNWTYEYFSSGTESIFGYTPEELQANQTLWLSRIHPQDAETILPKVFEDILAGRQTKVEFRFQHKDGTWRWISDTLAPCRDESADCWQVTCVEVDITERKRAEDALRESEAKLSAILNSAIAVIVRFRVFSDRDWEYEYYSPGSEILFGYTTEELTTNKLLWISRILPEDIESVIQPCFDDIFAERTTELKYRFKHKDGTLRWICSTLFSERSETENHWIVTAVGTDITALKQAEAYLKTSLQEKEVLLKEVHHRVKNNLQIVSSLLDLQSQYIQDPQMSERFRDSQNRIRAMALIHEKLYQSDSLARVNIADYTQSLTMYLIQTYAINSDIITLQLDVESVILSLDTAIPYGLILNELLSNVFKHSFPRNMSGTIWIKLKPLFPTTWNEQGCEFELVVGNDGIPLPEIPNFSGAKTLGFQLVNALVQQLQGQINVEQGKGTEFKLRFAELDSSRTPYG